MKSRFLTPRNRIEGSGSAKSGTIHFWHQRLSAIANMGLSVFLIIFILNTIGKSHAEIVVMIGHPIISALLVLTLISYAYHMKLGLQVVIEDYIHGHGLKLALLIGNVFVAYGTALLGIVAVLTVNFGG